jgi:hypothetical protein|tara:strand:+ start:1270 stop:1521 length:252 start_codon:yes stop_codon:yes gene_type:complete
MLYEFNNGTVESEQDTTPNGTKIVRLFFKEYKDAQKLYRELDCWAYGLGCEITILLKRDSNPYVVITPTTHSRIMGRKPTENL